ncbi:Carboxylic ester hydrolase [Mycena venus]|uniref:Carboxylic ester hydrolase n=1 Tax=Mycena venus TaxID=2733690 RepID=A0A8H7D8D0_9AGAR|nr:Carboxylic ester hydrolase [Mycena venus]
MALASLVQTALVFLVVVRVADSTTAPIVDLGYAQYQGVVDTKLNVTAFRGIRYAAPPTGKHARYDVGSASQYNGAELVQESNNQVVVVIIQYRLGLFGFLSGQQMKDDGALNAGLLDQEFALRWVNKNIFRFGGDPDKVTIWGESAGAGSVVQHIIAHDGKTSPSSSERRSPVRPSCLPNLNTTTKSLRHAVFNEVAAQAGCNGTKPLDCLRAVDGATMADINLNVDLARFHGTFVFLPVIDNSFITQGPTDALSQGQLNGDILLAVANTNEGILFVNQSVEHNVAEYVRNLFPLFGAEESNTAAVAYASLGSPLDQVNVIMGEAIFVCPTFLLLDAFPGASWKGEYAIPPALHGQDIINYFPSFTAFNSTLIYNNTAFINAFLGCSSRS